MSSYRYRDESSTGTAVASVLIGAVAGFAVGMFVAQRVGGFGGLSAKFRKQLDGTQSESRYAPDAVPFEPEDEIEEGAEDVSASDVGDGVPLLEERVLEAFNNDPILAERAIDIGALGSGIIELAGWVDNDAEAEHAMTVARGVPGVDTVVNRLMIDDEERQIDDNIQRFREGDPALTDARWEGQQVGTGKRRQGTSDEPDRHADPKPELEERWLSEREAIRNSAEAIEDVSAERRNKGGRKKAEPQPEA
jgi:hypothetical protein